MRLEVVVMVVETVVGELVEEHLGHMWHACAVRVRRACAPCAHCTEYVYSTCTTEYVLDVHRACTVEYEKCNRVVNMKCERMRASTVPCRFWHMCGDRFGRGCKFAANLDSLPRVTLGQGAFVAKGGCAVRRGVC